LGSLPRGPGARRASNPWLQRVDARHVEEQQDNAYRQGEHHGDNRDRSVCSRGHVTTLQVLRSRWSCSTRLGGASTATTGAAGGSRLQIGRRSPLTAAARAAHAPVGAGRDRPDSLGANAYRQRGSWVLLGSGLSRGLRSVKGAKGTLRGYPLWPGTDPGRPPWESQRPEGTEAGVVSHTPKKDVSVPRLNTAWIKGSRRPDGGMSASLSPPRLSGGIGSGWPPWESASGVRFRRGNRNVRTL
jgi:hypothetical protein